MSEAVEQQHDVDLNDLLTRCAHRDEVAFASLYDAIAGRVYGLIVRMLRDRNHAEDVTHETFIEVWRCAVRFDPARGTARAWVCTIAHRRAVDGLRSVTAAHKRDLRYFLMNDSVEHDSTAELALLSVEGDRVRSAMSRLTPLQRQAIDLAYFGGFTQSEVAAALRIPVGTAKTRVRDGLLRLRADLSQAA